MLTRLIHCSPVAAPAEVALRQYLEGYGPLDRFTSVAWQTPPFVLAQYSSLEAANKLLAGPPLVIDGVLILMAPGHARNECRLFLANIERETGEQELWDIIAERCAGLLDVKILSGKGVGFVSFETAGQATEALQTLNGLAHRGRPISAREYRDDPPPARDRQQGARPDHLASRDSAPVNRLVYSTPAVSPMPSRIHTAPAPPSNYQPRKGSRRRKDRRG